MMSSTGRLRRDHSVAAQARTWSMAEIFALMGLGCAIGCAAGRNAHILRHRRIGGTEQRQCDSDDTHDFLHNGLLFCGGFLLRVRAECT